jgi:hypothetical protein
MAREYQYPTKEIEGDREIERHPAFAQIRASRVSGGAVLYGSDFQHQNYVTISIARSEMHRNLSEDAPYSNIAGFVEVSLSEAQWATFVSSMNVGMGVPATLTRLNGELVPGIERTPPRRHKFKEEADAKTAEVETHLDELQALIEGSKLSQADKKAMLNKLMFARRGLGSSIQFILDRFAEYMEHTVEKARSEIIATAQAVLVKTGISKLMGKNPKVLGIDLDQTED